MLYRTLLVYVLLFAFALQPISVLAIEPGLQEGSRGEEVSTLQRFLKDQGLFVEEITGYFGKITKEAIIVLQEAYADIVLAPLNLTEGTGYVGRFTAAVLNADMSIATTSPTLTFSAIRQTLIAGQSTTLGWKSTNAVTCSASGGWEGPRGRIGSRFTISPLQTTTYAMTCTNATSSVMKTVTVTVTDDVTLELKASHPNIVPGQATTLLWKATNATYCTASGGWSGNGSARTVSPKQTTTYTLTCGNANKSVTRSVTVTVAGTSPAPGTTQPTSPSTPNTPTASSTPNAPKPPATTTPPSNNPTPVPTPIPTPLPATTTPATPTVGSYYVDFAAGADTNSGTQTSPWKHAPGDPEATGNPAKTTLKPGDVVMLKGGVTYYGSIRVNGSGTASQPVVLKGTGWGTGKAIIDGSQPITTFAKCRSAADCEGNPNWANIYKTRITVPSFLSDQPEIRLNLTQGDQVILPAQTPASANRFYQNPETFFAVIKEKVTPTSITDTRFASLGGTLLTGAYIYVWGVPNEISIRKIVRLVGSTVTLSEAFTPYDDRDTRYTVVNASTAGVFDTAGEYYFDSSTNTLYVWPLGGANPNGVVNYSVRSYGIDLSSANHVVVSGFKVWKQTGDGAREGAGIVKFLYNDTEDIRIENNDVSLTQSTHMGGIALSKVTNLVIENNSVHDTLGNMRGIQVGSSKDVVARGNTLRNIARTGLYFATVTNGRMVGNTMTDSNSTHGNGLTVYQSSNNVTVEGNTVRDSNIAFTMERSSNVTLTNNVFDGAKNTTAVLADWGGMSGTVRIANNTIIGSSKAASMTLNSKAGVRYVIDKNIIDGTSVSTYATYTNNIYVALGHFQSARYGWSFGVGERLVSPADLFIAPGTANYRVKPAYTGFGASR